jgi:hypothetical protein
MRDRIYISVLFALLSLTSHTQSIGAKFGFNNNAAIIDGIGALAENQTSYTGLSAGIVTDIPMTQHLFFSSGVTYIQKGFSLNQNTTTDFLGFYLPIGVNVATQTNYIEVPLALKYKYGNEKASVYVTAGPKLAYATDASLIAKARLILDINVVKYDLDLADDLYNRFEIGALAGIGGEVKAGTGSFFGEILYNRSFTNFLNDPIIDLKVKNNGIGINVGYKYNFGSSSKAIKYNRV